MSKKKEQLPLIFEEKELRSYIKKLEKTLDKYDYVDRIVDYTLQNIKPVQVNSYKPTKQKLNGVRREVVASLNDTHYGLQVDPEEVGGTNSFGWKEACRRTAFFVREVCDYKKDKRDLVDKLHLFLGGDMIAGVIHNLTGRDNDLLTHQVNGAIHILAHAITRLAEEFKEVVVYATPGNHGDSVHRREDGNRVVSQAYDSYENVIYYSLSAMFRNVKNVKFHIPKTPYFMADLMGGRLMFVHGHGVFSRALGNPGNVLNIKRLSDEIHRFNTGEIAKRHKSISMVMAGHTHCFADFITHGGIRVVNAPSLSGVDSYAQSLSINSNLVGQIVFETTKDNIFGDSRLVKVDVADNDKSLDSIIPLFKQHLSWSK